jgi:hypothetical protein
LVQEEAHQDLEIVVKAVPPLVLSLAAQHIQEQEAAVVEPIQVVRAQTVGVVVAAVVRMIVQQAILEQDLKGLRVALVYLGAAAMALVVVVWDLLDPTQRVLIQVRQVESVLHIVLEEVHSWLRAAVVAVDTQEEESHLVAQGLEEQELWLIRAHEEVMAL